MAFRFSLQAVLRLRASHERIERLRLLAVAAMIVRVRNELAALDRESEAARRRMHALLAGGLSGAELHFEFAGERLRGDHRRELEGRLEQLGKTQEVQRRAYHAARQKREILENLRQRKWEEYRRQQARREQQALDELFLIHRGAPSPE
ncbi:MAG: flagellar export protein FliJ [Acidobacteriia bacterium]|nr:flagellar export protein FliJ [Terriglobia bacterium]